MEPVIGVRDLRVRYPGAPDDALAGISFTVEAGQVFGFLGPNGSGKSTTQNVLTRLLRRFLGEAEVLGRPLAAWGADYYERIGVSFEQPAVFGRLTGRENLEAFASLHRRPTLPVGPLLDSLGLGEAADRQARTYSKGMRVRLDLARALLHGPDLLFLDEPTSGLDPVQARAVHRLVREQAATGRTVFLTTHDMAAAQMLCDRVAFVTQGRIATVGSPRELMLGAGRPGLLVEYRDGAGTRRERFGLEALAGDARLHDLLRRGAVETVHTDEASLADVFASVTGRSL
jgi:fluoroquinolone transport system ATP-binding protein